MSKKSVNLSVGTSPCPIRDCVERVEVFKYRAGEGGDEKRRRFAGRLYCMCPKHGRVENQEFLLEHVAWLNAAPSTAPAADPTPSPKPKPTKPTPPAKPKPTPSAPITPKTSSWFQDYSK